MKKYISLFVFAVMTACTKTPQPPQQNNLGGNNTPLSCISATESFLTAHWILDSQNIYNAGTLASSIPTSANMNDYFLFAAPYSTAQNNGNKKQATYEINVTYSTYWYCDTVNYSMTGRYRIQAPGALIQGYIISAVNNHLVVSGTSYGSVLNGTYYYFHK